jgi:hypothetical protein
VADGHVGGGRACRWRMGMSVPNGHVGGGRACRWRMGMSVPNGHVGTERACKPRPYTTHHSTLFTLCININIAKDLYLAGEAHGGIFLQVAAQPEFLHKTKGTGVDRGRDGDAVGTTEAVSMAICKFPHPAIDRDIVLQSWIAHTITLGYINFDIFMDICNGWHDLSSIIKAFVW